MFCCLIGHQYNNEIQNITQVFYPNERFILQDYISSTGLTAVSEVNNNCCSSSLYLDGSILSSYEMTLEQDNASGNKRIIKLCMYYLLKKVTGFEPPWGAMTGIRPSKIARLLLDDNKSHEETEQTICETYKSSRIKAKLCIDVAIAEIELLKKFSSSSKQSASLYIGIPFCPSRCLYCSFASYPINKTNNQVEQYLQCITKEMEALRSFFMQKKISTVYIGGGTPTTLNEKQLTFLLGKLNDTFSFGNAEFTVEAGRPDTLNREKLRILKEYGVSRISINPQTMSDKTLERIGRGHTADEFINAFNLARELGFDNINTDIILGLPGENVKDVENTMIELSKLKPDSITVHTLSVKRSSRLNENLNTYELAGVNELEKMLDLSRKYSSNMNMHPYYMYRQKNMLGNFENVGYSIPGSECLYNVLMMEETQSVAAIGAGGVTKIVHEDSNRIERIFNVKNVDIYIDRIDEMIERKARMIT